MLAGMQITPDMYPAKKGSQWAKAHMNTPASTLTHVKGMYSADGNWLLWGELWKRGEGGGGVREKVEGGVRERESVSASCQCSACFESQELSSLSLCSQTLMIAPALLPQQLQEREQDSISTANKNHVTHWPVGYMSCVKYYCTLCCFIRIH